MTAEGVGASEVQRRGNIAYQSVDGKVLICIRKGRMMQTATAAQLKNLRFLVLNRSQKLFPRYMFTSLLNKIDICFYPYVCCHSISTHQNLHDKSFVYVMVALTDFGQSLHRISFSKQ